MPFLRVNFVLKIRNYGDTFRDKKKFEIIICMNSVMNIASLYIKTCRFVCDSALQ